MHVIGVAFLMALLSTRFGNSAADSVPKLNVRPSCESAAAGAVVASRNTESCLQDERGAQDQIIQNWSRYTPTDKAQCIGMVNTGGPPSYVELLACLEIMKDSREIDKRTGWLIPSSKTARWTLENCSHLISTQFLQEPEAVEDKQLASAFPHRVRVRKKVAAFT